VADLVLLLVDASFGFEMEQFEFLNILQAHGFPKVMGVLTHLDLFKTAKKQRAVKKELKQVNECCPCRSHRLCAQ
jgi:ribosome biogenesis protein BMS1